MKHRNAILDNCEQSPDLTNEEIARLLSAGLIYPDTDSAFYLLHPTNGKGDDGQVTWQEVNELLPWQHQIRK
jgi:hypothetical protein